MMGTGIRWGDTDARGATRCARLLSCAASVYRSAAFEIVSRAGMSGPKGYGYAVISATELQRREDEAREGRCRQHAVTLAALAGELKYYGITEAHLVSEPGERTHDSLIVWESALQRAVAATQDKVDKASAVALLRRELVPRGEL